MPAIGIASANISIKLIHNIQNAKIPGGTRYKHRYDIFFLGFLIIRLLLLLLAGLDAVFEATREAAIHSSVLGTTFAELLLLLGGDILDLVGGTLVTADVHTNLLLERVDAEHIKVVEKVNVGTHDGKDPANDPKAGNDLDAHEGEVTGATAPLVEPADVVGHAKGGLKTAGSSEQTNGEDTPHAATEMDGDGINGIVNLEADEKEGTCEVYPASNDANDEGSPGLDGSAGSGDGNETSETTVHGGSQIVGNNTGLALVNDGMGEHGTEGTGGSSNGSIDGSKRSGIAKGGGRDEEGSSGVESVCLKEKMKMEATIRHIAVEAIDITKIWPTTHQYLHQPNQRQKVPRN